MQPGKIVIGRLTRRTTVPCSLGDTCEHCANCKERARPNKPEGDLAFWGFKEHLDMLRLEEKAHPLACQAQAKSRPILLAACPERQSACVR
eukprot:scaffold311476_cov18-Tisochrysis_lutea.AAC.1